MKRIKILLMTTLILNTVLGADAPDQKLETAINRLHAAMVSGVRAELSAIVSDHLSYGHSGGAVEDKAAFIEKIASGKSDFVKIDIEQQTMDVQKKVAVVRHILHAETNDGGKPGTVNLKVLLVWQKEKGQWKLLARQAVKI